MLANICQSTSEYQKMSPEVGIQWSTNKEWRWQTERQTTEETKLTKHFKYYKHKNMGNVRKTREAGRSKVPNQSVGQQACKTKLVSIASLGASHKPGHSYPDQRPRHLHLFILGLAPSGAPLLFMLAGHILRSVSFFLSLFLFLGSVGYDSGHWEEQLLLFLLT